MAVLNVRSTDLYVDSLKLHKSYHIAYMHINFVPTRIVEPLHKLTQLFLLHLICAHFYQQSVFGLLMNKEGWKGRGTVGSLIFTYSVSSR